jgi:hypothetical protein
MAASNEDTTAMETQPIALLAGSVSSLMFMSSTLPMLVKAVRTKDLRSYSPLQIVLANAGNGLYWLYVLSLPLGPIWLLHAFHTITTGLMLIFYLRYEAARRWQATLAPATS